MKFSKIILIGGCDLIIHVGGAVHMRNEHHALFVGVRGLQLIPSVSYATVRARFTTETAI